MTPDSLATALVAELQPSGRILEPWCREDGAFVRALEPYGDVSWCEIEEGRDFFHWTERVDWIVTNPPWSKFAAFLEHALRLADHVVFLVTVNHWWTVRRVRLVLDAGLGYRDLLLVQWPSAWREEGFVLGVMHLERGYRGGLWERELDWIEDGLRPDDRRRKLRREARWGNAPPLFSDLYDLELERRPSAGSLIEPFRLL
jgi:hypothetical protein